MTQKKNNPFLYSNTNKRYHTYPYYLQQKFGAKCVKIPIDAGFTCPNIDGKCATGGCIYCSLRGSGDFAPSHEKGIKEQIAQEEALLAKKWDTSHKIAYFQAHTNTYASVNRLKQVFEEALTVPGVCGLNIATRADCLAPDVLGYLAELSQKTALTVELGLQSSSDQTAHLINRGHDFAAFCRGFYDLRKNCPNVEICVHIILGLPGEDEDTMLATVRDVTALRPEHIKIHLLHVLKGTKMAEMLQNGSYTPMERDVYTSLVVKALELLPPETVIDRLTGDGKAEDLIAPLWSRNKRAVLNEIDKKLFEQHTYQGKKYQS